MDLISLEGKTNFFERRVGEYQKANVMLSSSSSDSNTAGSDGESAECVSSSSNRNKLNLDADF
jgi:ribonucleoside-diphosphate reductase beta chain